MHNFLTQQHLVRIFVTQRTLPGSCMTSEFWFSVHYTKGYRPFELFVNENYKL